MAELKERACLECGKKTNRPKFCSKKHANTYNSRVLNGRNRLGYTYQKVCKGCGVCFDSQQKKQIFCKKSCGTKWRARNVYGNKYSIKSRGKDPITFLLSLRSHYKRHKTISKAFLVDLYNKQNGLCALTGEIMEHKTGCGYQPRNISIDKINPNKGYVEDNIQLVCRIVNEIKRTSTHEQLYDWCEKILKHKDTSK